MLYKIADLTIEIPTVGDLFSRCREYYCDENKTANIVVVEEDFNIKKWSMLTQELAIYLESGIQFHKKLLEFNGMMLHSSAVELEGKAYLFSGPCSTGKSTHTRLWQQVFGDEAKVFNDDKPALRRMEDVWFAYGTPWCGKDGININMKVPLAGICFLKQGTENTIRRLSKQEAIARVLSQTTYKFKDIDRLDLKLSLVDQLVREIPIYELTNRPEPEAAILSYETMRKGAEEAGL